MPRRLAVSRFPLTGKPNTVPWKRFHDTCRPMAVDSLPLRRRAAASSSPATKMPIVPSTLALGLARCSKEKTDEETTTPQAGPRPSETLRSRVPREISSS
jgi:hypothetical protein